MSVSKGRFNKEAYYQGGGDVNEPTPGKPKYEKDPMNEKLRMEDKHMVGQKPFPDVGDVAGMHPSPESVSETNELERKKMLARAEAEERAIRRAAAVRAAKAALETQAYYQNGLDKNNANTPTPGQVKYKPDPLNEKDRELDKQMVGDKPFPDVGKVDDLYPGDRELKEKMSRASLKAKFVKAANLNGLVNLGESGWQVYHGDRLILTASVNDITGGRADSLYDTIATKEFGTKLLEKVKAFGPDRVSAMYKSAAEPAMPAAPGGMPAMPAAPGGMPDLAAPPPAPGGALPAGASTEDKGGEGDPKERAANLAQQAVDITSDLKDAVQALTGEREDMSLAGLTGGEAMPPAAPEASSGQVTTASLNVMRKELNYALKEAMLESIADLQDHVGELRMIAGMYDNGSMTGNNAEEIEAVVSEAFDDAKTAIANSYKLMGAFVKYARGTEALVKRASLEASDHNSAWSSDDGAAETSGEDVESMLHGHSHRPSDEEVLDLAEEVAAEESGREPGTEGLEDLMRAEELGDEMSTSEHTDTDTLSADGPKVTQIELDGNKYQLEGAAARSALRAKIAAEMGFSKMLDEAHPEGGVTTDLDVKPSGNLAHVEDLEELHDAMMDLANASPKAQKEAAAIHSLVSEGKLDASDVDSLVSHGVDKEAVAYYKKFYGQVDGGSEFASELVKEHVKAEAEQDKNLYRVKIARAYELANEMVTAGLLANDRQAVSAQVDEIMKFNDESFESMKRIVAKHSPSLTKSASKLPVVGMFDTAPAQAVEQEDLRSQLASAFSSNTRRMF